LPGFVEQCLNDLVFRHGFDDLTAKEDLAFTVARGDAEVGLTCFAGAVDHATHDGDAQGDGEALECSADLLGQGVNIDLGAATGGTGYDLKAAASPPERFQDADADLMGM
jgi:hypothetical protein